MSYFTIVLAVLSIGFVCPAIYLIYLAVVDSWGPIFPEEEKPLGLTAWIAPNGMTYFGTDPQVTSYVWYDPKGDQFIENSVTPGAKITIPNKYCIYLGMI